jgi:hypothetical protein
MPAYNKDYEKELIAKIRKIIVLNPGVSGRQIEGALKKNGVNISRNYITKLLHKIRRERYCRFERSAVNNVIAEFEDFVKNINEKLREIENSSRSDITKIRALDVMVKNYDKLLNMQFDMGVFNNENNSERKFNVAKVLEALKRERDTEEARKNLKT